MAGQSKADIRREKRKKCMQKLRQSIKSDPVQYEEYKRKERERYQRRKEAGKIKLIGAMNEREKRVIRKEWRKRSKRSYDVKKQRKAVERFLEEQTPPSTPRSSPVPSDANCSTSSSIHSRQALGEKIRRRNRNELKLEIETLKKQLKKAKRKAEKYKKRVHRLRKKSNNTPESPRTNVNKLLRGQNVNNTVKKQLMFGEVMSCQLKENFKQQKTLEEKRRFLANISGRVVKKYRYATYIGRLSSSKVLRKKKTEVNRKLEIHRHIKKAVVDFLNNDQNSRMCAGKKETITFKKCKKQRRYLNDSLHNIYRKFINSHAFKISYSTFCKFRPFYILKPDAKIRNTCLCVKHTNMTLIVAKLRGLKIIKENNPQEILKSLCCYNGYLEEVCLERKCNECRLKKIEFCNFHENKETEYQRWVTKRVNIVMKDSKEKICQKTIKETVQCTQKEVVSVFISLLDNFMLHVRNILHQYRAIDQIKKELGEKDVLFHMDFSENYLCKYAEEIQSAHFGSSKPQITLHTVVTYHKPEDSPVQSTSFCTLSESLRHDPSSICAHLLPLIDEMKRTVPSLRNVHFLTDGPTTQYRNKKMFYLLAKFLGKRLEAETIRWHFSESGHGKGAPDGIGGCIKRRLDSLVATGSDIPNFEVVCTKLQIAKGIKLYPVEESAISAIDKLIPQTVPMFKGTMKIHEITWTKEQEDILQCRALSCLQCKTDQICSHYGLGQINIPSDSNGKNFRLRYRDVYSDSESDNDTNTQPPAETRAITEKINNSNIPKEGNYVVAKLSTKKITKHYVAVVLSDDGSDEYTVKFLKRTGGKTFVFPRKDDIAVVDSVDILCILSNPVTDTDDQYRFNDNLSGFKNLV